MKESHDVRLYNSKASSSTCLRILSIIGSSEAGRTKQSVICVSMVKPQRQARKWQQGIELGTVVLSDCMGDRGTMGSIS